MPELVSGVAASRDILNVPYLASANSRQLLDLFVPESPLPGAPLVLFVHGGGWKRYSKDDHSHVGRAWARLGMTTAVMSYRISSLERSTRAFIAAAWSVVLGSLGFVADVSGLAPGWAVALCAAAGLFVAAMAVWWVWDLLEEPYVQWPAHRDDVVSALQFLGQAAQIGGRFEGLYNSQNVFVCGHSAGAHMALMTSFDVPLLGSAGIGLASLPMVSTGHSAPAPLRAPIERDAVAAVPGDERFTVIGQTASTKPAITVRGVVAMSPPAVSAMMSGTLAHRLYMRPAFGADPARWSSAFPDSLLRAAIDAKQCPRPPLLLATADPGFDLGLEKHVDAIMPLLEEARVPVERITIAGANHFTEMTRIGCPGSPAEAIFTPALRRFVETFGASRSESSGLAKSRTEPSTASPPASRSRLVRARV